MSGDSSRAVDDGGHYRQHLETMRTGTNGHDTNGRRLDFTCKLLRGGLHRRGYVNKLDKSVVTLHAAGWRSYSSRPVQGYAIRKGRCSQAGWTGCSWSVIMTSRSCVSGGHRAHRPSPTRQAFTYQIDWCR